MPHPTKYNLKNAEYVKDPGAYADTLTLRFDLKNALVSDSAQMPTDDELRVRDPAKLPYKEMPELVVGVGRSQYA